jgi:hypothetical protein
MIFALRPHSDRVSPRTTGYEITNLYVSFHSASPRLPCHFGMPAVQTPLKVIRVLPLMEDR